MGMNVWGAASSKEPETIEYFDVAANVDMEGEYLYTCSSTNITTDAAKTKGWIGWYSTQSSYKDYDKAGSATCMGSQTKIPNLKYDKITFYVKNCSSFQIQAWANGSDRTVDYEYTPVGGSETSGSFKNVSSSTCDNSGDIALDKTKSYKIVVYNSKSEEIAPTYMLFKYSSGGDECSDPVTVHFDAGDGFGIMDDDEACQDLEYTIPACTFTAPAGKEFDAWTSSGVTITDGKFTPATTADVTLIATWKDIPQVNFSLAVTNGYTETVNSKATHDITASEATISGGTASLYNGKSSAVAMMTATQINLGGSSGSYLKITFADGAKLVPGCVIKVDTENTFKLTATNSTSGALNTDATGAYTVTSTDILKGSNTLYVWKNGGSTFTTIKVSVPVYKSVSFVAGDAEATGSMDAVDVEVGEEYAIPTCTFEVAGKDFNGWTTSDVVIADGKFTMPNNNVTLTASWVAAATKYHVIYTAGTTDPITGDLPTQTDLAAGATFTLAALNLITREGYTQSHWYDGANYYFGGAEYTMPDHDVELSAYWKQTVNVTLDKNGATADGSAVAVVGSGELLNKNVVAHATAPAGWTLLGYYTAAEGGELVITADGKLAQAAVDGWLSYTTKSNWTRTEAGTLYAHWTVNYAQDIDFEAAAVGSEPVADVLSAKGYSYTGGATTWDNNTGTNNGSYCGLKMKEANSTVEFLAPAGKMLVLKVGILVNSKSDMYQDGVKVAENMAGGSKTTGDNFKLYYFYSDAEAQYMFKTTTADAQIIKAISFVDPYTVTFTVPAGAEEVAPMTFKAVALTLPAAVKGTDEFQGWYDAETAGNKVGDAGDAYTPAGNVTLYAQFSAQSTNNEIASFTYGEETVVATEGKREYAIELPYKSTIPASITVTKAEEHATVSEIAKDGGVFTFSVTAESGEVANYTVTFTVAKKDGICLTKTETTGSKNQTITGVYGDTEAANMVNIASDKKLGGSGQWIGVALVEGQTFAEGDIINVHTTTAAGQGTITIYSNTGKTATKIADLTSGFGVQGDNKFTLPAGVEAYSKLYVARTDANKWNGYVDFVAVTRVMNPILSALTVAGVDAVINQEAKTITVKLPNGTVAADAVLVPTIVANGGEPTAALAEALSYNTPVNYVVTDKDGDQTTYVLTATEAAAPAATPVITVQPASHDYLDTEVIAALTVVASTTDAGTLSYQWYKGEEVIAGATAATYTPTEAGSYKVVVTNTLGEETATATSEVAVITVRHIYTFNDWTSGATFTKAGEWTIYPYNKDNKWLIEDVKFVANQTISYADESVKANIFNDQYFVMKFENEVKNIVIANYYSGSDRYINGIYSVVLGNAAESQKGTATEITTNYEITYTGRNTNPARVSTTTINGHFEAGVYYAFKMSGGGNAIFDIFTTAATKVSEFAGLTAGKIGDADMTEAQLATLNNDDHTLTLVGAVSVAPAVKFTYKETETYDDDYVKTLASEEDVEAVSNRVGDNYEISKEIEGITYKVVVPVDVTPALALDVTEGTAAIAGKTGRSKEFTVTLTGANLANGEYSVTVPAVDGLTVTPAAFTVAAGEVNETFTITYAIDADVAEAIANIDFTVGTTTATFALTYSSVAWTEQAELEDVTESITWNFADIVVSEAVSLNSEEYTIYANAGIASIPTFDAAKIAGKGQWATRPSSDNFFQGDGLKFHTTVPGFVKITYRGTGNQKDINLFVNGEAHGHVMGAFTASDYIYVPAGDVEITFSGDSYGRVNKLEFKLGHSRTGYQIDGLGTICLPFGVNKEDIHGAVFYEVNYANCSFTYFDEVDGDLIAGKAYIFKATAADVALFANSETVTEPLSGEDAKGFIGTFVDMPAGSLIGKYVIALDYKLHICGAGAYLAANRAYIDMDAVPTTPTLSTTNSEGAPRRRLAFGGGNHIATDINALDQNAEVQKVLMDGVLYIIRAGKTYTPAGQLVK